MSNIETSDLETHLLECYLFVADYLQSNPKVAAWRRSNNDDPDFTDAEVIVIALMQGYFRTDTLKRTYQLVIANTEGAFPNRAGYKQWIRRLQRLPDQVGRLVRAAALRGLAGEGRTLYAADSLPIPLCEAARHGRVRLLAEDGAKFGVKASGDWFYGFKIHALSHQPTQMVITAMLLPGNRSDQVAARALARSTSGGVLLADEGYRGGDLFDWLYDQAQTLRAGAIGRSERRPFGRQPGPAAGRKQLFWPLAPLLRPGLRPVLARPLDEPAAEGAPLQLGASQHRVPTCRINPRLRLF